MPRGLRTIPLAIAAMGFTVDGREISEKDIDDIVATYNYKKYGARINLDHEFNWSGWAAKNLHGVDLNGGMLGDVLEVKSGTNDDGVKVLYAVLAPNASFVQLNQADQAVYFSIEINRDFMKSGQTYLTGLAVTDYPASAYTDRIHFSKNKNVDSEHPDKTNLLKVALELNEEETPKKNLFKQLFNFSKEDDDMKPEQLADALKASLGEPLANFTSALEANTAAVSQLLNTSNEQDDLQSNDNSSVESEETTELKESLSTLKDEFKTLSAAFNKAINTQADNTTDGEEENQGENGIYNKLL